LISGFGCTDLQQSKQLSKECLEVVPINENMLALYPNDNRSKACEMLTNICVLILLGM
jgi:hypothetical protein